MGERTAAEAKAANVAVMGDPLGSVYSELWQEVAWIHNNWSHYLELFGAKPSRIELLNSVAPSFFRTVQDCLFEAVLLHLARLTDRAATTGRPNLSLRRLAELLPESAPRAHIRDLVEEAVRATQFAHDWRNRRLAHRDLDLALGRTANSLAPASRQSVKDALVAIVNALNAVAAHFFDSTTLFDLPGGNDSVTLLYTLRDGLRAEEQRVERLKSGHSNAEDVRHEDI
ncbi:hypothetical protein GCM10027034_09780 [Ramlibacter solisilvae]|uniref:AbiU2 domain-containing protein n=1 Tax=Ramlibacter tataouinensis TaxID=94132 RepID=UPI0011AE417B|nr:hypothetical protein [Ramlibacter tataouinensis]